MATVSGIAGFLERADVVEIRADAKLVQQAVLAGMTSSGGC
jgi:hypothetical protein